MENKCKGITKTGKRCKNKNGLVNGYCKLHVDQAPNAKVTGTEKEPKNDYQENDSTVTNVVTHVNRGLSAFILLIIALISIIILMLVKGNNKRKKK